MIVEKTPLLGCYLVNAEPFIDHRGIFSRFFCENELKSVIGNRHIVNVNFSQTKVSGTIRGMHYQYPPYAEMKLVRCIKGKIFDVAIDIRAGSDTFLEWYGVELSADNMRMLIIPEGFAHGFQTLSDDAELMYFVTEFYNKESESGIRYSDPAVGINWPHIISDISEKDASVPLIDATFYGVHL